MRRMKAFAVLLGVVGATFAAAAPAVADDKDKLVDRIVAKADPRNLEVLVTTRVGSGRPEFKVTKVPDIAAARRFVASALGQRHVVGVEMNRVIRYATGAPNDPYFPQQWALNSSHLNFSEIRRITSGDSVRPVVAIIDTGVQGNHPDLSSKMARSYDAVCDRNLFGNCTQTPHEIAPGTAATDPCGHGTHVAGIVGASVNNGVGVAGMGRRVYIRSVRVFASCDGAWPEDIGNGITWAADHALILNMSFEGSQSSPAEANAIAYARSRGRILVAAAGNTGTQADTYPAKHYGVLGVGSVNQSNQRSSFSTVGTQVDVMAPGENILSTVPTNSYAFYNGTSMASPHVAALAALGVAHCRWGATKTVDRIQRTASHFSFGKTIYTGYGVINPVKLLRCV
jgi:subtilisin family serine protease